MSKLYFRSKALDSHRALPIYLSTCLPELSDSSSINRDVPEMPTGMEKEEECEKHCQMALVAQRTISSVYECFSNQIIIPTPHFHAITNFDIGLREFETQTSYLKYNLFEELSPGSLPEYDLDSDDEYWINRQEGFGVSYEHFELIFASLQGSSYHDTSLFHTLLCKFRSKFSEEILNNIYEYWLHRVRKRSLIFEDQKISPCIMDTPYSSFRKRNDRIITRRYRKHDEQNYEKMYQFKKTFEQLAKISENIYSREKLKYQLIYILKSTFSSRDHILDWDGDVVKSFYVDLSLGDFHTNTYFNSASSTFNTNRITDLRRTKQFKDEEPEAYDSKSCGVKYLLNNSNLRCSKFPSSLYTDSNISSTSNNAFSLNQDGRYSFVSNNISKYIPPQYPSLSEDRLKNRLMNVPYCRRRTLDLNVSNFQISSEHSSKNLRHSLYHKQRVKSTVYSYKYIYPKICSSPKRSLQSIFCLY